MTNQPDNKKPDRNKSMSGAVSNTISDNLDEVDSILERCSAGVGGIVSINGEWQDGIEVDEARRLLDQHYADLYRNKILEARKEAWERVALETRANICECGEKWSETDLGVLTEQQLDTITAQFNSTGDNDDNN